MIFSLSHVLLMGVSYLLLLFIVAYVSDSGIIPVRLLRHPVVYVLSLGVYVSAWAIFGAVGFAHDMGYEFLAYYIGISGAFLLAPVLLGPVLRLARTYHLGSLADLFAYRYRSQAVGALTSLAMTVSVMALLAMQIQAVADSIGIMTHQDQPNTLALWFCIIVTVFTLLFGTRHITPREKHEGLVVAIALESLLKLVAFLSLGAFAYFRVLGGPHGLKSWLEANPQNLQMLYTPLHEGSWHSLMLAFFFSAVLMPFMYQMTFTENQNPGHLKRASWGFPLYLLLIALPVPLILWAGVKLVNYEIDPEYFSLAVAMAAHTPLLALLVFVAGLSAASGVIIVTTLALASMNLTHLILPIYAPPQEANLYDWLLRMRRRLIVALIMLAYALFVALDKQHTLTEMGTITFVGTLQFAPGLVGVLFWPRGNRVGLVWGLGTGMAIWFIALVIPFLLQIELFHFRFGNIEFTGNPAYWQDVGVIATFANSVIFTLFSILAPQSEAEALAAASCSVDNLRRPQRWELAAHKAQDFTDALTPHLGRLSAESEVQQALHDLHMPPQESRPYALRRLRDQLESNLSGLLGPAIAQELLDQAVPYKIRAEQIAGEDIHYTESRLEEYRNKLSGLAGELDSLRRFHRQTLFDLPLGVFTLGKDQEILSWNQAMMQLTGITDRDIIGAHLNALPIPWSTLFIGYIEGDLAPRPRHHVEYQGRQLWVSMNRTLIVGEDLVMDDSQVVVVEDVTALHTMEAQLTHRERLVSIGTFAAGVAHEIGNPITAIACLAQNLRAESEDPDIREASTQIVEQTRRVSQTVQSMVVFARGGNTHGSQHESVPIRVCVEESIRLLQLVPGGRDYQFVNECDVDAYAHGDQQELMQVFVNLLSNARDASPLGGRIVVRCDGNEHTLTIEVEDFGSGLSAAIRPHLFEPFATTKDIGKGTGLGLALVHGIIGAHHGKIQMIDKADYDQGQGVIARITLPGQIAQQSGAS